MRDKRTADECNRLGALVADLQRELAAANSRISDAIRERDEARDALLLHVARRLPAPLPAGTLIPGNTPVEPTYERLAAYAVERFNDGLLAAPIGWKLVPIEPTAAMLLALGDLRGRGQWAWKNQEAWKAMLVAAPEPMTQQAFEDQMATPPGSPLEERTEP